MGLIPEGGPPMDDRDPNGLNEHVKVAFDDVLAEPEGVHSHECTWGCSYKCFYCGMNCCYLVLSFICGPLLALCWGCQFACVAFQHVWEITPCLRLLRIQCTCLKKLFSIIMSCCLEPICETCALCFSKVNVTNG